MHHVQFILISLIWGTSFVLMKWAKVAFEPITLGGLRNLGGVAVLALLWAVSRRRPRWPWARKHIPALAVVAIAGYIWPFAAQPWLIHRYGNSAFIGSMVCLVPILTMAFSIPLLKVYPTRRQLIGVAGALGFMLLLLGDGLKQDMHWTHLLAAVSVPASYAVSNILIKRSFTGVSALVIACTGMMLGTVALLPAGLALERVVIDEQFAWAVFCVAVLGLVGTGLATAVFYHLIQQRGPLFAGMLTYPVAAIALGWGRYDNEGLTRTMIVAVAGILIMVAVVQTGRPAGRTPPPARPR